MLGIFPKMWPTFLNFLKYFSLLFENKFWRFSYTFGEKSKRSEDVKNK